MAQHQSNQGGIRPGERLGSGVLLGGGIAACLILALRHPAGLMPACPTAEYLGLYCPGCGSIRATHHALNGRLAVAWAHNPLLFLLGVPVGVWWAAVLGTATVFGRRLRFPGGGRWGVWVGRGAWGVLVVLVVYGVLRNLPGGFFDGWRPPPAGELDH